MTNEEYEKQIIELKQKLTVAESEKEILKAKLDFAIGCFDELKNGLEQVIESTEFAKNGIV